ncbi:serine/arginine repetitive matrix protein 1 [Microcaecilia unicolor]|uniref:Serine/arginine repetitive matrix protein 1-like n=1 Tax=Microcaecilia unicolor TaxID=1415580 RepID=A0A6P7XEH1_9AMPH|nr:serine/arginine repetitive matrix protein 1-like [Microcaecilia unicolor]
MTRNRRWTRGEVRFLLDAIHCSPGVEILMNSSSHPNKKYWDDICSQLTKWDYPRSIDQSRNKWKTLKKMFYQIKQKPQEAPSFLYYDKIEEIWKKAGKPQFGARRQLPDFTRKEVQRNQERSRSSRTSEEPHTTNLAGFMSREVQRNQKASRSSWSSDEDQPYTTDLQGVPQASTSRQQDSAPPKRQHGETPPKRQQDSAPPKRQHGETPPKRQQDSAPPKRQQDSAPPNRQHGETPPKRQQDSAPPNRQHGETPPKRQHEETPPKRQQDSAPPNRQHGETPPKKQQDSAPPNRQHGETPPKRQHGETPPKRQQREAQSQPQSEELCMKQSKAPQGLQLGPEELLDSYHINLPSQSFSIIEVKEEEQEEEDDEEAENLGMRKKRGLTFSQLVEDLEAVKYRQAKIEAQIQTQNQDLQAQISSSFQVLQAQNQTQFQALQVQNKAQFEALQAQFQAKLTRKRTSSRHNSSQ